MQYNYMDVDYQAGTRGLHYAASKGLAVVVMEPLHGGRLAQKMPESVNKLWASAPQKRTPAQWGLLWVWNHPQVTLALSGMTRMEQIEENVAIANNARPNNLTSEELAIIDQVK